MTTKNTTKESTKPKADSKPKPKGTGNGERFGGKGATVKSGVVRL